MKVQHFISPFKIYERQLISDIWVDFLTGSFWSMIWNNREGWKQMSLMALSEGECIDVPSGTSVIRDIRIAPSGTRAPGRLALVASLGKKLTVFRYGHFFWPSFNLILCLLFNHPGNLWMSLCILWILSCSCFLILSVVETGWTDLCYVSCSLESNNVVITYALQVCRPFLFPFWKELWNIFLSSVLHVTIYSSFRPKFLELMEMGPLNCRARHGHVHGIPVIRIRFTPVCRY